MLTLFRRFLNNKGVYLLIGYSSLGIVFHDIMILRVDTYRIRQNL